jgi:GDP-D-mannose dehydratase
MTNSAQVNESAQSKKNIFVFLATGDQGKSACKYLVEAGYGVYGLTRDPRSQGKWWVKSHPFFSSDRLRHLDTQGENRLTTTRSVEIAAMGVILIKGDMANVETYIECLSNMHGAFVNADCASYPRCLVRDRLHLTRSS